MYSLSNRVLLFPWLTSHVGSCYGVLLRHIIRFVYRDRGGSGAPISFILACYQAEKKITRELEIDTEHFYLYWTGWFDVAQIFPEPTSHCFLYFHVPVG